VHVIGPELGVTQPGMTIVCGDSHQGPDPRDDRSDRGRRRRRPRRRVRRSGDRGAVDGGPDDRLQHDDRGWR
jgi:hypothetical protein